MNACFFALDDATLNTFLPPFEKLVRPYHAKRQELTYSTPPHPIHHFRVQWPTQDQTVCPLEVCFIQLSTSDTSFHHFFDVPMDHIYALSKSHLTYLCQEVALVQQLLPHPIVEQRPMSCIYLDDSTKTDTSEELQKISQHLQMTVYAENSPKLPQIFGLILNQLALKSQLHGLSQPDAKNPKKSLDSKNKGH